MSRLPSGVSVLRHVPAHLVEGHRNGDYKLWGGVLRRATGEGRGQIVGFLTEGWELAQQVEQGLPINAEALKAAIGNTQMASQMAMGIYVLNLGVQVAGFAMVMRRLDAISSQIETVRCDLNAIGENVQWLTIGMISELRAKAANALATADRAIRRNERHLLDDAKTLGDGARSYLANLCSEMLVTSRAVPQRGLFEEFMKLAVLVAYAEARCVEAVEGPGQAAKDLAPAATELRRLADSFRDQVRNFEGNPLALIKIGDKGRAETKALAARIDDVVARLEGYVPQLELQDVLGLDARGWRALVAGEGSGPVTCITFDEKPKGDLLEAVMANTKIA
jgi:hypothetical protein